MYTEKVVGQVKELFGSGREDLQVAYVGKAPLVSTYEPGLQIAERERIQALMTEDINEALEWLDVKKL